MKRIFEILLLILPLSTVGQTFQHEIDSIVQSKMSEYRVTALSIGLVKNGKIFYCKGFGYTNIDSINQVTEETKFPIESITKLHTATGIMQLVDKGELDLNATVIDYLPEFKLKDKRYKDIKIIHLLTHSSGLPWDWELKEPLPDSIALESLIASLTTAKLKFAPGEQFNGSTYSNIGYDLLGYIIQRKTKKQFSEIIESNLRQIGMENTTYNYSVIPYNLLARPNILSGKSKEIERFNSFNEFEGINPVLKYKQNPIIEYTDYPYWNQSEHYPCGYLYSTATDMSKFIINLLNIYNNNTSGIIKQSTLTNMWSLQRSIEGKKTSIGLGWWRFSADANNTYVFHVGNEIGFSAVLRIYPNLSSGIVVMTNAKYAENIIWNELPDLIMKIINQ